MIFFKTRLNDKMSDSSYKLIEMSDIEENRAGILININTS